MSLQKYFHDDLWRISGQLWGQGGSGKSFLASSLDAFWQVQAKNLVLMDLDLGAANLHTMVDVPYPEKCFSDFVSKKNS